jgi:hypothetical protein
MRIPLGFDNEVASFSNDSIGFLSSPNRAEPNRLHEFFGKKAKKPFGGIANKTTRKRNACFIITELAPNTFWATSPYYCVGHFFQDT